MRTLVVVQARLGSSRLPGKVLLPLLGEPVLVRMLERIRAAKSQFELVVATTSEPEDAAIVSLCQERNILVFRGSTNDLLDRHYRAALQFGADVVVKIPSDCPLIDPAALDHVLGYFLENKDNFDFVSNLQPPSWPDGNDVEIMTMDALKTAWIEAQRPFEREHTTPFIWDNNERFRIGNVLYPGGGDYSATHRFVLDYEADYQFIRAVFERLLPRFGAAFSLPEILELLSREPELMALNRTHLGVCWQQKHLHELKTLHLPQPSSGLPHATN
ncbi:MAG: glycosyltransferase family protein [Polyangiaceae bacterium]|nr:glycosyltransferase family protein [Polyangiaceae bacterium]